MWNLLDSNLHMNSHVLVSRGFLFPGLLSVVKGHFEYGLRHWEKMLLELASVCVFPVNGCDQIAQYISNIWFVSITDTHLFQLGKSLHPEIDEIVLA